jgi:hypothetical protein
MSLEGLELFEILSDGSRSRSRTPSRSPPRLYWRSPNRHFSNITEERTRKGKKVKGEKVKGKYHKIGKPAPAKKGEKVEKEGKNQERRERGKEAEGQDGQEGQDGKSGGEEGLAAHGGRLTI